MPGSRSMSKMKAVLLHLSLKNFTQIEKTMRNYLQHRTLSALSLFGIQL